MELIWLVLSLLVLDLAALLFAADTRPGLRRLPPEPHAPSRWSGHH
jgi:hypothetical protein